LILPEGVLARYDLGEIEAIDPQRGGWIGEVWRVTGEEQPLDHRCELQLAEGLWAWLQENAAFLEAAFA
jgi:hypothetical protein